MTEKFNFLTSVKDYMKMKNFEKYSSKEILEFIYTEKLIEEVFDSLCNPDSTAFVKLFLDSDEKEELKLAKIYILLAILDGFIIGQLEKEFNGYCDNLIKDDIKLADAFIQFEFKKLIEEIRAISFCIGFLRGVVNSFGVNPDEWVQNFNKSRNENLLKMIHQTSNKILVYSLNSSLAD